MSFLQICCLVMLMKTVSVLSECKYPTHHETPQATEKIKPLIGRSWEEPDKKKDYSYTVTICAGPKGYPSAGVLQTKLPEHVPKIVVGNINNTSIMAGTGWVQLEYSDGDKYNSHCNSESRRAHILLICDESNWQGTLNVVEENTNKSENCYYLFELSIAAVCDAAPARGLSTGSVFCVVFVCLVGVYLILGFIYQRLVVGAKGWEQVPNYAFWKDFGNLQADGCDFVCRTGAKRGSREYRGIGDDQLPDETIAHDDSLLPM